MNSLVNYITYFLLTLAVAFCDGTAALSQGLTGLPAFPGAEGYGKYTTGGRGGQVLFVTTTEDVTTQGSLRWAINQTGPRIIIFRVSGTIKLKSALPITRGDVTIAGQTAPGDGICIRDYPVRVEADNVIIRYMRFRLGDESDTEADALEGRFRKGIIIDHCSMSWSVDECASFYQNEDFTMQWCIISESLRNSVHDKGAHGYGGIWGGRRASFHHNLLAHHDSRNPRLGERGGDEFALTDLVDLRNNVIYNWQGNSCYGGEAMNVSIVNCYYKPGPATTKTERIVSIDKYLAETGSPIYNTWGKFYINGNYMSASVRATNDNWTFGVFNQFNDKYGTVTDAEKTAMRLLLPQESFGVTTHTAQTAYARVLDYAGASLKRDTVDRRVVHDARNGIATFMTGGNGSVNGIIDTQSAVGGWPLLASIDPPADSDGDGMPDSWETDNNLNPSDPSDAGRTTVDGRYPNIEVYINSLVAGITDNQNREGIISGLKEPPEAGDGIEILFNREANLLTVNHTSAIDMISIFSSGGTLIKVQKCSQESMLMQLPGLKPGIYFVRVIDHDDRLYTQKFMAL